MDYSNDDENASKKIRRMEEERKKKKIGRRLEEVEYDVKNTKDDNIITFLR